MQHQKNKIYNTCSKEIPSSLQIIGTDLFIPSLASSFSCWIWSKILNKIKKVCFTIHLEKLIKVFRHDCFKLLQISDFVITNVWSDIP